MRSGGIGPLTVMTRGAIEVPPVFDWAPVGGACRRGRLGGRAKFATGRADRNACRDSPADGMLTAPRRASGPDGGIQPLSTTAVATTTRCRCSA